MSERKPLQSKNKFNPTSNQDSLEVMVKHETENEEQELKMWANLLYDVYQDRKMQLKNFKNDVQ